MIRIAEVGVGLEVTPGGKTNILKSFPGIADVTTDPFDLQEQLV